MSVLDRLRGAVEGVRQHIGLDAPSPEIEVPRDRVSLAHGDGLPVFRIFESHADDHEDDLELEAEIAAWQEQHPRGLALAIRKFSSCSCSVCTTSEMSDRSDSSPEPAGSTQRRSEGLDSPLVDCVVPMPPQAVLAPTPESGPPPAPTLPTQPPAEAGAGPEPVYLNRHINLPWDKQVDAFVTEVNGRSKMLVLYPWPPSHKH